MNVNQVLQRAQSALANTSDSPALDAEVLLAHTLGCSRSEALARFERRLSWLQLRRFNYLISRRRPGVPVAYLTRVKDFYGRQFMVNRHVLIPRPETELLVEEAIRLARANQAITTVIDLGTGSGCLAVSLALELPRVRVVATDISPAALRVAKRNAHRHAVSNRTIFLRGNLIRPLLTTTHSLLPHSLLLANLPYLRPHEVTAGLRYEPTSALVAGADGLDSYRALLEQLTALPANALPHALLLELHPPTAAAVTNLLRTSFPHARLKVKNDLRELPRLAILALEDPGLEP